MFSRLHLHANKTKAPESITNPLCFVCKTCKSDNGAGALSFSELMTFLPICFLDYSMEMRGSGSPIRRMFHLKAAQGDLGLLCKSIKYNTYVCCTFDDWCAEKPFVCGNFFRRKLNLTYTELRNCLSNTQLRFPSDNNWVIVIFSRFKICKVCIRIYGLFIIYKWLLVQLK